MPGRAVPPYPPAELGLRVVASRNEWMQVFKRVRAHPSVKLVGVMAAEFANYDDGAECQARQRNPRAVLRRDRQRRPSSVRSPSCANGDCSGVTSEGTSKFGRSKVADCYRLTVPGLDVLSRVPLLTPDYEPPEDLASGQVIDADPLVSSQVIEPEQLASGQVIGGGEGSEHLASEHLVSEHLFSEAGTPYLSSGTPGVRTRTPIHRPIQYLSTYDASLDSLTFCGRQRRRSGQDRDISRSRTAAPARCPSRVGEEARPASEHQKTAHL